MRATKVTSPRTSEKGKPTQIDRLRAATRQMSNERADLSVCIDLEQPEHFLPLRLGSIGGETGHVFIKPSRRLGDLAAVLEPIVLSERHDVEGAICAHDRRIFGKRPERRPLISLDRLLFHKLRIRNPLVSQVMSAAPVSQDVT